MSSLLLYSFLLINDNKGALAGKISELSVGPTSGGTGGRIDFSRSFGYFSIKGKVTINKKMYSL